MKNLFILLVFFALTFSGCSDNPQKSLAKVKQVRNVQPKRQLNFKEWWNIRKNNLPSYSNNEYLRNYDMPSLLKYYNMLVLEYYNNPGNDRFYSIEKELAEKTKINFNVFKNLNNYFGLEYYKYLGEITKEYFTKNKLGIKPDYYTPIGHTAYLGLHTFNCDIVINKCKDDPAIQDEIDKKIEYLKQNLPSEISGFRVFSIDYNCKSLETSGDLSIGYIWKREGDVLTKMKRCKGTWKSEIPERTAHWCQDSWTDGKKLLNNYDFN